jgi:hypothetical protein
MLCGGSIIDASHILSAGHCFYTPGGPPDPETIRVFAGQAVMYSGAVHKVSIRTETMIHFKYCTVGASIIGRYQKKPEVENLVSDPVIQ